MGKVYPWCDLTMANAFLSNFQEFDTHDIKWTQNERSNAARNDNAMFKIVLQNRLRKVKVSVYDR